MKLSGDLQFKLIVTAVAAVSLYVVARRAASAGSAAFDSAGEAISQWWGDTQNAVSQAAAPITDALSFDLVSVPDARTGGRPSQGDVRRFDQYILDHGSPLANLPNAVSTWAGQMRSGTADPYNYSPMG